MIEPEQPITIGPIGLRMAWAEWDARPLGASDEWAHPGLAVAPDRSIVVFDQTSRELVRLAPDQGPASRTAIPAACAHGLTASGTDTWVADTGVRVRVAGGKVITEEEPGSVFCVGLSGQVAMTLPRPEHPSYATGAYIPTSVAVAETGAGGGGDIWVADGYGQALVHRFTASGEYQATLDGSEGGGQFDRAHCVFVDRRGNEPRLLVTDRSNHRVAAYDLDGHFIKLLGVGELRMPSAFALSGDFLIVAELWSRLAVYDPDDRLLGFLGEGEQAWEEPGWPNRMRDGAVDKRALEAGRFNAPHGLDAAPDGTIYVAEWSLGGRIVELRPSGKQPAAKQSGSQVRHACSVDSDQ